jgi:nucleotide-binding universal stress UspA family protein
MENILVPTDFSNNAYSALFYAVKLLKGKAGTFHLLNAYDEYTPLRGALVEKNRVDQLKVESLDGLQHFVHRIKLDFPKTKHAFTTISHHGALIPILIKEVEARHIDLVVMGNSGISEVEAIFLGSNALDTISSIQLCPVLTIPKEHDFKPPKEIAFVTDYHHSYDAELLQPLLFIAKQYRSKISLMHIHEEEVLDETQEKNKSILLKYLLPFEYKIYWMPLFKTKANSIHTFLDELEIDMLTMVNYEHSFLKKVSREPVVKRMAFDLDIPFLIIPTTD